MLVSDFIRRKNKIIFDKLGVILVPEDQIEECKQFKLYLDETPTACPYCHVYTDDNHTNNCAGCPMEKANNKCTDFENTTWSKLVTHTEVNFNVTRWYQSQPEIVALYEQYNAELNINNQEKITCQITQF